MISWSLEKDIDRHFHEPLKKEDAQRLIVFRQINVAKNQQGRVFVHLFDKVGKKWDPDSLTLLDTKFHGVTGLPRVGYVFMNEDLYRENIADYERIEKKYEERRRQEQCRKEGEIRTPVPNPKHDSCHTCVVRFNDYREHIKSDLHRQKVLEDGLFREIDKVIADLDAADSFRRRQV